MPLSPSLFHTSMGILSSPTVLTLAIFFCGIRFSPMLLYWKLVNVHDHSVMKLYYGFQIVRVFVVLFQFFLYRCKYYLASPPPLFFLLIIFSVGLRIKIGCQITSFT